MGEVTLYRTDAGRRMGSVCSSVLVLPFHSVEYRGTSLIRNTPLLGPYSRTIPRVLWRS